MVVLVGLLILCDLDGAHLVVEEASEIDVMIDGRDKDPGGGGMEQNGNPVSLHFLFSMVSSKKKKPPKKAAARGNALKNKGGAKLTMPATLVLPPHLFLNLSIRNMNPMFDCTPQQKSGTFCQMFPQ